MGAGNNVVVVVVVHVTTGSRVDGGEFTKAHRGGKGTIGKKGVVGPRVAGPDGGWCLIGGDEDVGGRGGAVGSRRNFNAGAPRELEVGNFRRWRSEEVRIEAPLDGEVGDD